MFMADTIFVIMLIFAIVGYLIWDNYLLPEKVKAKRKKLAQKNIQKEIDSVKKTNEKKIEAEKIKKSFTGTTEFENDPIKFFEELKETQKKLDNGEQVGVDAAQAFFLIRNYAHHDLITGEDGIIRLKQKIEQYKTGPSIQYSDGTKIINEEINEEKKYIKRTLENGTEVFSNFSGQLIPNPDGQKEKPTNEKNQQLNDLSKKLTANTELLTKIVFDNLLEKKSEPKAKKTNEKNVEAETVILNSKKPAENEDEILVAPSFDFSELDSLIEAEEKKRVDKF